MLQDEQEAQREAGNIEPADLDNEEEDEDDRAEADDSDDEGLGDDPNNEDNPNNSDVAGLFSDFACDDNPPTTTNQHKCRHTRSYRQAWEKIKSLEGRTVDVGQGADKIKWRVVEEVLESCVPEDGYCGVKPEFGFGKMSMADAFLLLWPGDMWGQLETLNKILVDVINVDRKKRNLRATKIVSKKELLTFISLVIAASQYNIRGRGLWRRDNKVERKTFTAAPDFGRWMNFTRFNEIKNLAPLMMVAESGSEGDDPWWRHRGFVDGFNKTRQDILMVSRIRVLDETMSALRPR